MFSSISKSILKLGGWKITGQENIKDLAKFILIGAPHTSSLDFILGILVRSATNLETRFLGKQSLFRPPFGFLFRAIGGYPVDRTQSNNMVDAIINIFNSHERFSIALAPEGTRQRVEKFKSGFYHIAKGAEVPIILFKFNFGDKALEFSPPFFTGDDATADMKTIEDHFRGVVGIRPERSFY